jgi:hypothetical protein
MRTWTVGTVSGPSIGSVRFETQEIRFHQRVKYQLAQRLFNAAQTLHLVCPQPQSWHFQILGTQMVDDIFNRSHGGNLSGPNKSPFAVEFTRRESRLR